MTLRFERLSSQKLRDVQLANFTAIGRSNNRVIFWPVVVCPGIWAIALLVLINDTKEPNCYTYALNMPHVYIVFTETVDYISIETHLIQRNSFFVNKFNLFSLKLHFLIIIHNKRIVPMLKNMYEIIFIWNEVYMLSHNCMNDHSNHSMTYDLIPCTDCSNSYVSLR